MIKVLKKKLRKKFFSGVRKQMVTLFLLTVLLTALAGFHLFNPFMEFIEQMDTMFEDMIFLSELSSTLAAVDESLRIYLTTRDSDSLLSYYEHLENLRAKAAFMQSEPASTAGQSDRIYSSISLMIESYKDVTEAAVNAKRGRTPEEYMNYYENALQIADFINLYISELNEYHLGLNTKWYLRLSGNIQYLINTNYFLVGVVILLNVMIILYSTSNVTAPIEKLSKVSEEIAAGNFDAEDISVSTDDEFLTMANAFNKMKRSISEYIAQLQDKAETETRLMEQQLQNLKMKTLLSDAELKALQLQINPHFMFNTLNAAMQLSIMESADKTTMFIDNFAKLLRYYVGEMNRSVTIEEEIAMIVAYKELFDVRFGNIQSVDICIDNESKDALIPPMTIQPFVENAYIHGLGDRGGNGFIKITVKAEDERLNIQIFDNGAGMEDDVQRSILERDNGNKSVAAHSRRMHLTGIGIDNVVSRLKMFFGVEEVLNIQSKKGEGTTIILTVPLIKCDTNLNNTVKRGAIDV